MRAPPVGTNVVRPAIYVAAAVALAAAAPDLLRSGLASAASVLLESLPYLALSGAASRLLGRYGRTASALCGCGCGDAPTARSIPAALAAGALFGPGVALARFAAALAVARIRPPACRHRDEAPSIIGAFASLVPAALLCGMLVSAAPLVHLGSRPPWIQAVAGIVLGFAGTPCALGGVALASSLRAQSPIASIAVLAIAGIVDLPVWTAPAHDHRNGDGIASLVVAGACALIAYERGAALIHPRIAAALWIVAAIACMQGMRTLSQRAPATRWTSVAFAIACVIGSPPPPLTADEASFDGGFAGERVSFTGRYLREAKRFRVVRYAITCCRADARPVALTLRDDARVADGTWIRANGTLEAEGTEFVLRTASIQPVAPPTDPFIYR